MLQLAQSFFNQGQLRDALQLVQEILQKDRDNAAANHLYGHIALSNGKLPEAQELYQRACDSDPGNASYRECHALAAASQGKLKLAEQSFQEAIRLGPLNCELWFKQGVRSYRGRDFVTAQTCFEYAIRIHAGHAEAWNALGATHRAQQQLDRAIECYQTALAHRPEFCDALNNLGIALEKQGRVAEAETTLRRALELNPNLAAGHNSLGNVLTQQGDLAGAAASFRMALSLAPEMVAARNNLGLCLRRQGDLGRAIESFQSAVEQQPQFVEAWNNLGNALRAHGELPRAVACFERAIELNPRSAHAQCNLGHARLDQRNLAAADECYRQALQLDPNHAETFFGLANVLRERGEPEKAIQHYEATVRRQADHCAALNNLGNTLRHLDRLDEAIAAYERAIEASDELLEAHNNLGNTYRQQQRYVEAAECYRQVLNRQHGEPLQELRLATMFPTVFDSLEAMHADAEALHEKWWQFGGAGVFPDLSGLLTAANEPPFNLQFLSEDIRPYKQAYANIFSVTQQPAERRPRQARPKIGFVVTGTHEAAFVRSLWGVLQRLSSHDLDVVVVCSQVSTKKFQKLTQQLPIDVLPLPDRTQHIVEVMAEAKFDVLYYWEVGTDALNYFMPFVRLAPVQCTSWGIQVTTGIPNMDYYLSSSLLEPQVGEKHYSEKLLLAESLLTYQSPVAITTKPLTRDHFGLPTSANIYLCAQQLGKFHPDFDALLLNILTGDSDGILVLTDDRYGHVGIELRKRFAKTLGQANDRVRFLPRQSVPDYLNLIQLADVLLDPPHFTGVNSTYDAFSLGKFIVTRPSPYHRGRYTSACYERMEMSDCVAHSADDYVQLAIQVGTDKDYRRTLEEQVVASRAQLFEDRRSIDDHLELFSQMLHEKS